MELIGVEHRSGAAFQVTDGCTFLRDDQRALELTGIAGIDPEVGGELHWALHTLRDEDKGAIAEDS